jgi:tetratricopeptide (TPR) repeat protein
MPKLQVFIEWRKENSMSLSISDRKSADILTRQGLAALRAGDKSRAYTMLTQALTFNEHNDQTWLWLAATMSNPAERRYCLEQALEYNPENATARHGLALLSDVTARAPGLAEEPQPAAPLQEPAAAEPQPAAPATEEPQPAAPLRPAAVRLSIDAPPPFRPVMLMPTHEPAEAAVAEPLPPVEMSTARRHLPVRALMLALMLVVLAGMVGVYAAGGKVLLAGLL